MSKTVRALLAMCLASAGLLAAAAQTGTGYLAEGAFDVLAVLPPGSM